MEQTKSPIALIQGIEAVISKCRASLTAEEIELLKDAMHLLQEIDGKAHEQENQVAALCVLMKLIGFLLHPEVIEELENLIHQLF